MRATVVRIGHMFSRPAAALPLLAVPLVAGGLYAAAAQPQDVGTVDYQAVPVVSAGDGTGNGPVGGTADARAALDRADVPFGLLESGFGRLTEGAAELDDGAGQMADGLTRAREGSAELADGLGRLDAGLTELGDGSARLNEGVGALVGALSGVAAVQGQVVQILTDTINDLSADESEPAQRAVDQLTALRDVVEANGSAADLPARLEELRAGSEQITYQLDDPAAPFAGGVARAADGAEQLRDGLVALDDGGTRLTDGTDELVTSVQPVDGVLASLAASLEQARAALPDDGTVSSTSVTNAAATSDRPWTAAYPIAALVVIAATLAAMVPVRRRAHRAVLPAAATALCGWVVFIGSVVTASVPVMLGSALIIGTAVAAVAAAGRAVLAVAGWSRGRWIVAVAVLIQVLLGAIAEAGGDRAATALTMFTPIGWVGVGLGGVVEQAPLREMVIPLLVCGTLLAIALSILTTVSGSRRAREEATTATTTATTDADTTGADTAGARTSDAEPVTVAVPATDSTGGRELDRSASDAVALVIAGRLSAEAAAARTGNPYDGVNSNSVNDAGSSSEESAQPG